MKLSSSLFCGHKKENLLKIFSYKKKPSYEKKFDIKGKYHRNFYQCDVCHHMYASHKFNIEHLYSKQYLEQTYKDEKGINNRFNQIINLPFKKSDNKNRVKRINKFINNKNLNLLDVGSGTGVFLYEMRRKNWNVVGLEMDKRYANFCQKYHKIKVYCKKITKFKPAKKFNLISFNKVLEHVKNPINLVNMSKNFLKKNGTFYIEVPHIRAKNLGKHRQEFCIDHLHIFSKNSLIIFAQKCGLKTIEVREIHEPSGKFTIFGFFQIDRK